MIVLDKNLPETKDPLNKLDDQAESENVRLSNLTHSAKNPLPSPLQALRVEHDEYRLDRLDQPDEGYFSLSGWPFPSHHVKGRRTWSKQL